MLKKLFRNTGPGPLIAAAFIGPGTVTLCTIIGANYGLDLLWTILVSILIAILLQGMAVRLGIIGQKSITQVIKEEIESPWIRGFLLSLIFTAIMIGNTAYEAGNISGAVLGLETLFGKQHFFLGEISINLFSIFIGLLAGGLLWVGKYKIIERVLIVLVILMSISFLTTSIATGPSFLEIINGLFRFSTPKGSLLSIIGLVGTTIVPYNLFLHTELVREKWSKSTDLPYAMKDMIIALVLGGIISLSIIITAASIKTNTIESAADLALGLEPLFGSFAKYFLSLGLFAAGITSTITAPLAASYVVCGCMGWKTDLKSSNFQRVWAFVILFGVILSATGLKLIFIIQFAQITNGILLPIIAAILLWIMNKSSLLGVMKNNTFQNALGLIVVILALTLSARSLWFVSQNF
jgi:NRAMP (natural resistance-associated macrophage protein)-like metal ion transporter